ncbi:MAG: hypothetical protein JWO38_2841 [Gemmataceae bacterium]|nr:hypothetical protein [Gemmataceae bacterium]
MSAVAVDVPAPAERQQSFVQLLPAIRAHARAAFRHLRSEHDREDAEGEVVARAWETFRSAPAPLAVTPDRLAGPAVAAVRDQMARTHR